VRICDKVTILRDGKPISTHNAAELDKNKMVTLMVGGISTTYNMQGNRQMGETLEVRGAGL